MIILSISKKQILQTSKQIFSREFKRHITHQNFPLIIIFHNYYSLLLLHYWHLMLILKHHIVEAAAAARVYLGRWRRRWRRELLASGPGKSVASSWLGVVVLSGVGDEEDVGIREAPFDLFSGGASFRGAASVIASWIWRAFDWFLSIFSPSPWIWTYALCFHLFYYSILSTLFAVIKHTQKKTKISIRNLLFSCFHIEYSH